MASIDPEVIANINHMRRSTALAKYRRKLVRCERLLIAAHYLIVELSRYGNVGLTLSDNRVLHDIEEEIGHK